MKTFYENKNNKYKEVDTNGNTIYLLTTWEDGSPNAWEDANKLAKAATAEAWRSGLFKFMARKPATAADFFDELPYTSTSDFAAVWNCSRDVVRASNSALHLEGVALAFVNDYTEPRTVFVWCEYNSNGDEMRTGVDNSSSCRASQWLLMVDGMYHGCSVYNIGGNNFFRLRDLGNALGFGVDYDAATNSAVITA